MGLKPHAPSVLALTRELKHFSNYGNFEKSRDFSINTNHFLAAAAVSSQLRSGGGRSTVGLFT